MANEDADEFLDRKMREYKLRTAYGGLANNSRRKPSKYNRVQVAHSDGCCSPNDEYNSHSKSSHREPHTPRHAAHDRSHSKFDSSDPLYHQHGRVNKNYNQTKKSNQQQTAQTNERQSNKNSTQSTVSTTKKNSCCCCCTIL